MKVRQCEVGSGAERTSHLPIGQDKFLRVVSGYKHLGAMTTATLRFDPEVAARAASASCAESAISRVICGQAKLPRQIRVNIVGSIQASLLYAVLLGRPYHHRNGRNLQYGIIILCGKR